MNARQKAEELVGKFAMVNATKFIDDDGLWDTDFALTDEDAVECALICINRDIDFFDNHKNEWFCWEDEYEELLEVKLEIEKL